jgi:predicted O-methyltransferase YrrM
MPAWCGFLRRPTPASSDAYHASAERSLRVDVVRTLSGSAINVRNSAALTRWRLLAALLPQHPQEFLGRVAGYVDVRSEHFFTERLYGKPPQYDTVDFPTALKTLAAHLGDVAAILDEPALAEVEDYVRHAWTQIRHDSSGNTEWGADSMLARYCYLVCRLLEPHTVIETGASYGVSSAFFLAAIEQNGHGTLHSIDLPALRPGFEKYWGVAVPEHLKASWRLHRGSSRHVLPQVLSQVDSVDVFLSDSLHSYRSMHWEYQTVWPRLRPGGVLLSDDVMINRAFAELQELDPQFMSVVRDADRQPLFSESKPAKFGIAMKRTSSS